MAVVNSSKMPLFLPEEALQSKDITSGRRASNGYLAPSPATQSLITPQNATSSAWRTVVCPFAPERRTTRPIASLEPTPTSSPVGSFVTPANLWHTRSEGSLISIVTGVSTTASSGEDRFGVRTAWSGPAERRGSEIAAQLFSGDQSSFSADMTPIAATGDSATRRSSDFEWLAPVLITTAGTESATPTSCASIGLNTARIFDTNTPISCTSSVGLNKAGIFGTNSAVATPTNGCAFPGVDGKDMGAFFVQMPDNGPSIRMRGFGA